MNKTKGLEYCKICSEYHTSSAGCDPILYYLDDDDGIWEEIRAKSFSEAAEKYAEIQNSDGDYAETTIRVFISDGIDIRMYDVYIRQTIDYSADRIPMAGDGEFFAQMMDSWKDLHEKTLLESETEDGRFVFTGSK